MDGTAGVSSTAESSSMTAAQSQPKPATTTGAVEATLHPAGGETLNGSTAAAAANCHIPRGGGEQHSDSSPSAVTLANGPASARQEGAAGTVFRTSLSAQNTVTSPVASPQPSVKTVPTVTLVRPPMQTSTNDIQSNPTTVLTPLPSVSVTCATTGSTPVNKADSIKTIMQTGVQVVASTGGTGTTATVRSPTVLQNLRTAAPSTITATAPPPGGIRTIAPQVLGPRLSQPQRNATTVQITPGMVLLRSDSGQLMLIDQQALAQVQAQAQSQRAMTPRPATPTSTPPVQVTSLQTPGAPLLGRPVTPTTIIKQGSCAQTTITATTTLQRPPVLQNTIMLGGSATSTGASATVQPAASVTQRMGSLGAKGTPVTPTGITPETLENVKKCKNFLSTLIKLASSGKQSSETTANVKQLVKSLLEAKIEPEDFTSRLYQELNSSPQPYLVLFLKRSLPALRQMTPDPEAFIQESQLPQPTTTTSSALSAVVLRPPLSSVVATTTGSATIKTAAISLSQTPNSKHGLVVPQQQGTVVRPQVALTQSPIVAIRGQTPNRIIVGHVVKQMPTVVKQPMAPVVRGVQVFSQGSVFDAQKNKLKEAAGGTFRDDDDINDVASMAGVNLSEESARIMATSSQLVGMVTRSCVDETFLSVSSLTQIALEFGKKFGVNKLGTNVINYISQATQQRLRVLLEKASHVAQQKNTSFKEDAQYEQVSNVRAQLKFFEQLDQMEKQRKDEEETEMLMKAAKSRSRQEDPEQLRLKQKAKEMEQLKEAQIRQREANLTALAAIGPRKKRKADSPVRGATAEGAGSGPSQPGGSSGAGSRQFTRQRITRVNLRDLLFCLENEKETSRSQLLYKGFLK
ncbi:transcription initiation factor TFIID subunit 4 [Austrofundulus limnaeus]|uniref:Transcription initiation factor TFIID subunit 4 n=1 Tax=Austrofundulus limnaeus TaxID=52670 RepID=A0A2I4DA73_AUSLI|nr:PREDICTED: transcription initiation factor TFIID subunit 4 [Austrofundulus limnaeus]XP_013889143.1 PREDICTED: transcription initiation factor TFIID subunit 4 [Austrofundulus limnaeus]